MLDWELEVPKDELASRRIGLDTLRKAVELFDRHGSLVLREVFDKALIEKLRVALEERYVVRGEAELASNSQRVGDRRLMISVDIESPFDDPRLYANPIALPVLFEILGFDVALDSFTAVVAFPGSEAQSTHRDHDFLFPADRDLSCKMPAHALTLAVPLVDLTPQTGTTALWGGSHRMPYTAQGEPALPYVPAGSAYLMDYRLIHGGTANSSDRARPILYMVFARSWFRDSANFKKQNPVPISAEAIRAFPEALRSIFRYARSYSEAIRES